MEQEIIKYINRTKNTCSVKVGDINVKIKYSQNSKTFEECLLNIIQHKIK